jgi:UDP-glucose:(heptosyl)LPS alpha-1,3-glucosyltransferase
VVLAERASRPYVFRHTLKVALVILHADPARGGAERYTWDLADALAGAAHDVSLVYTADSSHGGLPTNTLRNKVKLVPLAARGLTRTGRYRGFIRSLNEHLRAATYDVVHAMLPVPICDVYHPHAGVAAAQMKRWNAIFNPRRRTMARVERGILGRETGPAVICLSDYVKRFVREYYPRLPGARMVRLFNAVDLARFVPPDDRPGNGFVNALMIAQDYERKGLRQAIAALAKVSDPRLRLLVVGKEDPSEYAAQAKTLGLTDRVVFHPPTSSPQECYRNADFFVLPTSHDPCSLVVLEALAMGLPVISTRFNGACEIMTPGVHGFVLNDPQDISALAKSMTTLCDDGRRREMSRAALSLRPKLAYEHHLQRLTEIYQDVIATKQGRR